jgi:hypothetical protein
MRRSGASLAQSVPSKGFRTVASGTQNGFVGGRNNSSQRALREIQSKINRLPKPTRLKGISMRTAKSQLALGRSAAAPCPHPLRAPLGARRDNRRYLVGVSILDPPAAELDAVGLCPTEAGHDPLADHRSLELSEHAQHLEHRPAGWRRCIEPLLMQERNIADWAIKNGVDSGSANIGTPTPYGFHLA